MTPLKVIFLADTRPGHYHLAEGVIAALARLRPVEVTRIQVKRKWIVPTRWLRRRINAESFYPPRMLRMAYRIEAEALPKADLVVSAGGETQMPNICVTRFLGVPNIFCGSLLRGLGRGEFQPGRFPPMTAMREARGIWWCSSLPPSIPKRSGARPTVPRYGPDHHPQLAGLLIGGNAGPFRYRAANGSGCLILRERLSQGLGHALARLHLAADAGLTSPTRLPSLPRTRASSRASSTIAPPALARCRKCFGKAEVIVCTEDSSTMVSEAVSARLPVVGVAPEAHRFTDEESAYRDFLVRNNWCRVLPIAALTLRPSPRRSSEIEPIKENPLDALAAKLKERLPALF